MEDQSISNSQQPTFAQDLVQQIQKQMASVIIGQHQMVELLLASLLADGHVLIEGVPGVAKTLTAKLLAKMLSVGFSRIQFTPDLMPSDVTGTNIFNAQTTTFQFKQGPIFANIVLIDEINRAPAKTQASLFEVMEERQITNDGQCYPMKAPFMVLATQNPIEHEGTYRLPEAQLDRFLAKIIVAYPSLAEEISILQAQNQKPLAELVQALEPVVNAYQLADARAQVRGLHVEDNIIQYIAQIVHATRQHPALYVGASPRASIALLQMAKAIAVIRGRSFVIPDDVTYAVYPVLRHRLSLSPEREMEGATPDDVIKEIMTSIEVPR